MFLIKITQPNQEQGAYFITDENQDKILLFFEEQDDALRYAMQINPNNKEIDVEEYDDELLVKMCKIAGYKFTVVTENDIIFPPQEIQ
jgi:hypothetical protein